MKFFPHPLKLCFIAVFSFVLFSCSGEDDGIYFDASSDPIEIIDDIEYSTIESEILALVNNHRISIGLAPLAPLNIVSNVAGGHTEYMIATGKISHDNFTQRTEVLMKNAKAKLVGENVAFGFISAQGVLNGWLNSEGHKAVIENSNYTHFGISTKACEETGRNYFTQIFIEK